MTRIITLWAMLTLIATHVQSATFTVNSSHDGPTCDASICTLRGALLVASGGGHSIEFNIPTDPVNENYFAGGSGSDAYFYWVIQPQSPLPAVADLTIDGTTAGASTAGNPSIVLDGVLAGIDSNGLTLEGDALIQGLALINWDRAGIHISDTPNNRVQNNWSGLNLPYGLAGAPNHYGVYSNVFSASGNVVGGAQGVAGNVLSGNNYAGLYVAGEGQLAVLGNFIGTDASGTVAVPNPRGIFAVATQELVIGLGINGLGNLISGNEYVGIRLTDAGGHNTFVIGNFIGTDVSGNAPLPNREGMVLSWGSDIEISDNVISGNDMGILMESIASQPLSNITIKGNHIGVGADGVTAVPNARGIYSDGHELDVHIGAPGEPNLIAHNQCTSGGCGVILNGTANSRVTVRHNSFFNNANLGLDLDADGFTANDPDDFDAGPNRLQNYPAVTSAQHDPDGNRIQILYRVDSHNGSSDYPLTLDLYAADASAQEGQTWLASTQFSETQYLSGAPVSRTLSAAAGVQEGDLIVLTATGANGRTSEFSPGVVLAGQADFSIQCDSARVTTTASRICPIDCTVTPLNGWGDEVGLVCPDGEVQCQFVPSEELSFPNATPVNFTAWLQHLGAPGLHLAHIEAGLDTQGGPMIRSEAVAVHQLAESDYLFRDTFDGDVCVPVN